MKKILHIINTLDYGGAEKLLVDIIPLLQNTKYSADVLLLKDTDNRFFSSLIAAGINVYSLGLKSQYSPIAIVRLIPYLSKYDLIHSHLFPSQYWVVIAKVLSLCKTPIITTEHTAENIRRNNFLFRFIERNIYQFYKKIICISPETKAFLCKTMYKRRFKTLVVINNGVDTKKFIKAKPYLDIKHLLKGNYDFTLNDVKIILQVAAFRDSKDQDTLIKAATLLPQNYIICLVGDGKRRQECIDLVDKLNLNNRVFFLGLRTDIESITKTADIVVLSSKWEGFGLVAVEGMAAGKPLIASNVPGLCGVVKGAGVLFEVGDYNTLARNIKEILSDENKYTFLSKRSIHRAQKYDINIMVSSYMKIYDSILM